MVNKLEIKLSLLLCTVMAKLTVFKYILIPIIILMAYLPDTAQAGICFLPDCQDKQKTEADNSGAEECRSKGYESDKNRICPTYSIIEYCPENTSYIKCDEVGWCNLNGYIETVCAAPEKLFDKCPNSQEMYKECKLDDEEACKLENPSYVSICQAGWTLDPEHLCSLSPYWGFCCNMCPGYNYTASTIPEGATAVASCESCDGKKFIIADEGLNQCPGFWDCQDGCEIGSETCVSGGVTKCKTCKRCEAKCSNLTCPTNAYCEYENCTQRYCEPTGCAVGYTNFCTPPKLDNCAELGYDTMASACKDAMGMFACPFNPELVKCVADDGTCCSRYCEGYDYTAATLPAGYHLGALCKCCGQTKYKIVINGCDGFVEAKDCPYGVAEGTETCKQGDLIKYRRCKDCPNATDHKVCPEGAICTLDTCSNTYTPTGCKTNYTEYCDKPMTNCGDLGYTYIFGDCRADADILYCPYDKNFVRCIQKDNQDCCRTCEKGNFIYESVPEGYTQTGSCECCAKTLYSAEINTCEGYVTDKDCKFGADTSSDLCKNADTRKYAKCIECPNATDMKICPGGYVCSYDACSKSYEPTGCASGFGEFCDRVYENCEYLGYRNIDGNCAAKTVLRCPYDSSKVVCL